MGGTMTLLSVSAASTGKPSTVPSLLLEAGSTVPLALAYGAGLLLALRSPRLTAVAAPFAAVGQMAMTNYLMQSVALSLLFYGYGLGLTGRMGSAAAAVIGLVLYAVQVGLSCWWLRRYRFGPIEWLWRSLTYGHPRPATIFCPSQCPNGIIPGSNVRKRFLCVANLVTSITSSLVVGH